MQKHKNKNKLKHKDLNRKGAEKEGTDMDAFVNPAAAAAAAAAAASKPEAKTQQPENKVQSVQAPTKDTTIPETCPVKEPTKGMKDKENNETKNVISEPESAKTQKGKNPSKIEVSKETSSTISPVNTVVQTPIVDNSTIQENHKEVVSKESTPTIEESAKIVANDVVDHVAPATVKDEIDVEAIVAQKNEENTKVSALHAPASENLTPETPVIANKTEVPATVTETAAPAGPRPLKYPYKDDQWSPRNVDGKKEYPRDFLMKLQDDPKSQSKPESLPNMDVVLTECNKVRFFLLIVKFRYFNAKDCFAKFKI